MTARAVALDQTSVIGHIPTVLPARSAYCERLWASFSVKLLVNIGSCVLQFFGLVSEV